MHTESAYSIADFEPCHITEARSLWQQSEGVGLSNADEPQSLRAFLLRNPSLSFVAVQARSVVGTVLCGHDGRRGLIHHLVVANDHQRKGVGRLLLRHGLKALRRAGIEKCHLLVFNTNQAGLSFWRSVGADERVSIALFSLSTENGV